MSENTADPPIPHHCHANNCKVEVPPRLLMCLRHWRMVPSHLQALIWEHYRPGQEIDKRPTPAYLAAMERAIKAVEVREKTIGARKLST